MLPFIFGRIMSIETYISVSITDLPVLRCFLNFEQNQSKIYREVLIAGDLSPGDVDRARSQPGAFALKVSLGVIGPTFYCSINDYPAFWPNVARAPL
jgi:hypothetical protein